VPEEGLISGALLVEAMDSQVFDGIVEALLNGG
jgi:hypothetical protein